MSGITLEDHRQAALFLLALGENRAEDVRLIVAQAEARQGQLLFALAGIALGVLTTHAPDWPERFREELLAHAASEAAAGGGEGDDGREG